MPVKVVVYNISALGLIASEAENVGVPAFRDAMPYPKPDHAIVARLLRWCPASPFERLRAKHCEPTVPSS